MEPIIDSGAFRDCADVARHQGASHRAGVYSLRLGSSIVPVFCDADGWTVFQSRGQFGNSVGYFYRGWDDYLYGFGIPGKGFLYKETSISAFQNGTLSGKEHWLWLENLRLLTSQRLYELRSSLACGH